MALHTMSESQKEFLLKSVASWYDSIFGYTKMEWRGAQLQEWEQREIFQQLDDVLVSFNVSVHDSNNHTIGISCIILYTI